MRVLAISIDKDERNNIELVDTKAEAGYLEGFQNPEYIRDLPKISFPNIPKGTYRGFEVNGESMLPMEPGSILICQYLERIDYVKNDKTYVIISKDQGVVYKRIKNIASENALLLTSDNEIFTPYSIPYQEIDEIWEYYAHVSFSDAKVNIENIIEDRLFDIQKRVKEMQQLMNKNNDN
jgi:phage repressor protein C with HTH and peptisase S24 domain